MSTSNPVNEVAGRKNFGPDHALVTTPQPCVMIATWDKDHNPDVMMAAWAGQYDYKQIVVSKTLKRQALSPSVSPTSTRLPSRIISD